MTLAKLEFNPSSLLWKTRGKYWEFEFISTPSHPKLDSWWSKFQEVFQDVQVDEEPKIYYGELNFNQSEVRQPYLAAACFDAEREDWTRRRIQHFLIWFPNSIESAQSLKNSVPADWHNQILTHLDSFLNAEDIFDLSEEEIGNLRSEGKKLGNFLKEKYSDRVTSFVLNTENPVALSKDDWSQNNPIAQDDRSENEKNNLWNGLNQQTEAAFKKANNLAKEFNSIIRSLQNDKDNSGF